MPQQGQSFDVDTVAQKYGLDADILRKQIAVESGGNPRAVSPKGALGLMQLMPENAKDIDPFDPAANVERGASIMGRLVKKYGGDYTKALAAYNAGEGAVDKAGGIPAIQETQSYVMRILAGKKPAAITNAPSFNEIAAKLPPDLGVDEFEAIRSKYFEQVIAPKVKDGASLMATRKEFMAMTERPPLLTSSGRAALAAQITATAAVRNVAAPLRAVDAMSGTSHIGWGLDQMDRQQEDLNRMGEREGLNTKALETVGTVGGQIAAFEAGGVATSGVAAEIAANFASSARTVKLASSLLRGGMTFGTYDALSAKGDQNRMVEGLKGFGIGASLDLVLGTPGFLLKRGAASTPEIADGLSKVAASGIKPPPEVDKALAQKAVADANTARAAGRPNEIRYTNGQRGARVYVTDVSGNTQPIEIKQYREVDTQRQVANMVAQGGSVSHFEVHPEDGKLLNDYIKIQTKTAEASRGTTLATTSGQAPAIARAANAVGLPSEAVAPDTVHVATVTHEVPAAEGPKPVEPPVQASARTAPTRAEIDAHLEEQNVAPQHRDFVTRAVQNAWDEGVPPENKRYSLEVTKKFAPGLMPKLQSDAMVDDALKAWDLKPSDVDVEALGNMTTAEMNKTLAAAKSRVESVDQGTSIAENRPRVTDQKRVVDHLEEQQVPPSERGELSLSEGGYKFGDRIVPTLHNAIEDATGGKFLDQRPLQRGEAELRLRPGGPKIILPKEGMAGIGPKVAGASAPDGRAVLQHLGIEVPPELGDATPVTILKEGETRPVVIYHENLHTNMHFTGAYGKLREMIPQGSKDTATDLLIGIRKKFSSYEGKGGLSLANEAFVHAAQAFRFGDDEYLQILADMDTSVGHVAEFVNGTAKNILKYTLDEAKDSIPTRNLQRSISDIIRRTDTDVTFQVAKGVRLTGSGSDAWYDPARGWVLQEGSTQRSFGKLSDLWDHLLSNDKNNFSPDYSFMPEQAGMRGGMTPPGAEPDGSGPPNPEVSLGARLGFSAASKWWRPMMPWAASLDMKLNRVLRAKGITLPIYDAVKDVDDGEAAGVATITKWREDSGDILKHFSFKKGYDVAQYLTHPETERTDALLKSLGMTKEEGQYAHLYDQWLKEFQNGTSKSGTAGGGIDVQSFLRRDYPRLRMHEYDPSSVWGPGISQKNAGFWEKAVRYDQTLEPRDLNIHRLNTFLIRAGNEKMFTGEPLAKLNALIQRVDENKEPYIPADVRSGLKNYHDYMKGLPDDSKQSIEDVIGNVFSHINNRIAVVNEHLPEPLRASPITLPPRQFINRAMLLSYTSGLGLRPAIAVRDGLWSMLSSATWLGARGSFTRGLIEGLKPEGLARARAAGALLTSHNIGELLGDVTQEMPVSGANLFDKMTRFSNMILSPSRWFHNVGRGIMFNGEYFDALDSINEYRGTKPEVRGKFAGPKATIDTFFKNTSLPALDPAAQNRLLRFVNDPSMSPHDVAVKFGREAVDVSQWPYRRGTQPMALRYTAGRILGQYGVWPANYVDFGARVGRLWFQNPSLAARMTGIWAATNYASSKGLESMGADTSKWFFLGPAGYQGSPNLALVQNLLKAPEDTQEGREARRAVLSYPLDFVPATAEVESVLKGMSEPGGDQWPPTNRQMMRLLGFKPLDEHVETRDWKAWIRYQMGYPKLKPGEE